MPEHECTQKHVPEHEYLKQSTCLSTNYAIFTCLFLLCVFKSRENELRDSLVDRGCSMTATPARLRICVSTRFLRSLFPKLGIAGRKNGRSNLRSEICTKIMAHLYKHILFKCDACTRRNHHKQSALVGRMHTLRSTIVGVADGRGHCSPWRGSG